MVIEEMCSKAKQAKEVLNEVIQLGGETKVQDLAICNLCGAIFLALIGSCYGLTNEEAVECLKCPKCPNGNKLKSGERT